MKKLLLGLIISVTIVPVNGQNQADNLTKYWRYRDRLRERFIVVNEHVENYGVNIPAASIDYDNGNISWGDANSNMSHYLSVLATELWLLKRNNQDYSTTLKELYYAMLAMERLDTYSEYSLRWRENIGYWIGDMWIRGYIDEDYDINGFHIRDDVSSGFWNNYKSHFDVPNFSSVFNNGNMEEISQDNIYHNLEGLALVAKLVGTESVAGIPTVFVNDIIPNRLNSLGIQSGSNINFSLWAKDFVKRYIRFMQNDGTMTVSWGAIGFSTHWFLINPITQELVREGSGSDLDMCSFYHHGVIKTGEAITGENLRVYGGLISPPERIYDDLFRRHAIEINYPDPIIDYLIDELFGGIYVDIDFDDYKLRSLSCNGNALGTETFSILRNHRDNYNPYNTDHYPIYEHFPLMYLILHDPNYDIMAVNDNVYAADQILYENLINSAPNCGSISNGIYEWSSTSRCVWPESLGQNSSKNIEYSGLDYMMLHNLYYIAFRKEDYNKLDIGDLSPYRLISANAGMIEAHSSVLGNNITYSARNSIVLQSGFSVSSGKNFEAKISPRPNNYQGGLYRVVSAVDCKSTLKSAKVYQVSEKNITPEFFEPTKMKKQDEPPIEICPQDELNISIFPNPSKGRVNISLLNTDFPVGFEIISVNGLIVYKSSITSNMEQFDVSNLSKGIYLIRFHSKNKVYTKKLSLIY